MEDNQILNIKVRAGISNTLRNAKKTLEAIERGQNAEPYYGVGFEDISQMLSIFTPRRWDLLAWLREQGAMTVAELARQLSRNYKNVHDDVERLMEWLAVEKDEHGKVFTPYSEIVVDVHMPDRKVA